MKACRMNPAVGQSASRARAYPSYRNRRGCWLPLDQALLEASRRYEDGRGGFAEEFIRPVFGGTRTVGVLSCPLGAQAAIGWLICHSFGREQTVLSRVE